ncbi:lipoprotein signal peptidase [bacterium BMS3Bbin04]|nr:lipoprotein signal peptidase [bacterium BMS3Bbin04]
MDERTEGSPLSRQVALHKLRTFNGQIYSAQPLWSYELNRTPKTWIPLLLTLLVIVLDRVTKLIADATMDQGQSIHLLGDAAQWTLVYNYGMAFGMNLAGGALLGYVSVLAVVVILFVLLRTPPRQLASRWILAAILGGAVGNTYDRIRYGYVIDFIDVNLPDFLMERWPVFNLADSAVSVGVVLLLLMMIIVKDDRGLDGVSISGEGGTIIHNDSSQSMDWKDPTATIEVAQPDEDLLTQDSDPSLEDRA